MRRYDEEEIRLKAEKMLDLYGQLHPSSYDFWLNLEKSKGTLARLEPRPPAFLFDHLGAKWGSEINEVFFGMRQVARERADEVDR
jgi:hypothetical protein